MTQGPTVGGLLQKARKASGLSQEVLALELKLPTRHLQAIEGDDWEALPPGQCRPLVRQLAMRLGVDLEFHSDAFLLVPGAPELEPTDPRQERLEQAVMGLLTAASVVVVLWLVVPGPRLGRKPPPNHLMALSKSALPPPPAPPASTPYPVLGELLPEAPQNEQGTLVSLRAMDTCEARIEPQSEAGGAAMVRDLRVSEPWRLRVKGPFVVRLDNAGVVVVEVAGHQVPHGQSVGEPWLGRFDSEGRWLRPPQPVLPGAPEVPDDDEKNEDGTPP